MSTDESHPPEPDDPPPPEHGGSQPPGLGRRSFLRLALQGVAAAALLPLSEHDTYQQPYLKKLPSPPYGHALEKDFRKAHQRIENVLPLVAHELVRVKESFTPVEILMARDIATITFCPSCAQQPGSSFFKFGGKTIPVPHLPELADASVELSRLCDQYNKTLPKDGKPLSFKPSDIGEMLVEQLSGMNKLPGVIGKEDCDEMGGTLMRRTIEFAGGDQHTLHAREIFEPKPLGMNTKLLGLKNPSIWVDIILLDPGKPDTQTIIAELNQNAALLAKH